MGRNAEGSFASALGPKGDGDILQIDKTEIEHNEG
jgi:hypothetical protein